VLIGAIRVWSSRLSERVESNRRIPHDSVVPQPNDDLLRAVELALAGEWDAAHQLVQQYEDDAMAAWIHAVLHKIEGDLGNAQYWYRYAGRMDHVADEPCAELIAIQAELTTDEHG